MIAPIRNDVASRLNGFLWAGPMASASSWPGLVGSGMKRSRA